eukprot:g1220.t1
MDSESLVRQCSVLRGGYSSSSDSRKNGPNKKKASSSSDSRSRLAAANDIVETLKTLKEHQLAGLTSSPFHDEYSNSSTSFLPYSIFQPLIEALLSGSKDTNFRIASVSLSGLHLLLSQEDVQSHHEQQDPNNNDPTMTPPIALVSASQVNSYFNQILAIACDQLSDTKDAVTTNAMDVLIALQHLAVHNTSSSRGGTSSGGSHQANDLLEKMMKRAMKHKHWRPRKHAAIILGTLVQSKNRSYSNSSPFPFGQSVLGQLRKHAVKLLSDRNAEVRECTLSTIVLCCQYLGKGRVLSVCKSLSGIRPTHMRQLEDRTQHLPEYSPHMTDDDDASMKNEHGTFGGTSSQGNFDGGSSSLLTRASQMGSSTSQSHRTAKKRTRPTTRHHNTTNTGNGSSLSSSSLGSSYNSTTDSSLLETTNMVGLKASPVQCQSERQIEGELENIYKVLSESLPDHEKQRGRGAFSFSKENTRKKTNSKTGGSSKKSWAARMEAMKRLAGLLHSGAYACCPSVQSFASKLKTIGMGQVIAAQVSDLRSQICKAACALIVTLAASLGHYMEASGLPEVLFTPLVKVTGVSIAVMSESGSMAMRALLKSSTIGYARVLPKLMELRQSRSVHVKEHLPDYLLLALTNWSRNLNNIIAPNNNNINTNAIHDNDFHNLLANAGYGTSGNKSKKVLRLLSSSDMENTIKQLVSDASSDVRKGARRTFWAFDERFSETATELLLSMDISIQKAIHSERSNYEEWREGYWNQIIEELRQQEMRSDYGSIGEGGGALDKLVRKKESSSNVVERNNNYPSDERNNNNYPAFYEPLSSKTRITGSTNSTTTRNGKVSNQRSVPSSNKPIGHSSTTTTSSSTNSKGYFSAHASHVGTSPERNPKKSTNTSSRRGVVGGTGSRKQNNVHREGGRKTNQAKNSHHHHQRQQYEQEDHQNGGKEERESARLAREKARERSQYPKTFPSILVACNQNNWLERIKGFDALAYFLCPSLFLTTTKTMTGSGSDHQLTKHQFELIVRLLVSHCHRDSHYKVVAKVIDFINEIFIPHVLTNVRCLAVLLENTTSSITRSPGTGEVGLRELQKQTLDSLLPQLYRNLSTNVKAIVRSKTSNVLQLIMETFSPLVTLPSLLLTLPSEPVRVNASDLYHHSNQSHNSSSPTLVSGNNGEMVILENLLTSINAVLMKASSFYGIAPNGSSGSSSGLINDVSQTTAALSYSKASSHMRMSIVKLGIHCHSDQILSTSRLANECLHCLYHVNQKLFLDTLLTLLENETINPSDTRIAKRVQRALAKGNPSFQNTLRARQHNNIGVKTTTALRGGSPTTTSKISKKDQRYYGSNSTSKSTQSTGIHTSSPLSSASSGLSTAGRQHHYIESNGTLSTNDGGSHSSSGTRSADYVSGKNRPLGNVHTKKRGVEEDYDNNKNKGDSLDTSSSNGLPISFSQSQFDIILPTLLQHGSASLTENVTTALEKRNALMDLSGIVTRYSNPRENRSSQ